MNAINIPYLSALNNIDIKNASLVLDAEKDCHSINQVNWPIEFPYCPDAKFKIARSKSAIIIHFHVIESNLRAKYQNDHEPVWEDSCVEFFCKLPEHDHYFNFEFNCICTCLATKRKGRELDVQPLSEQKMNSIKRYASLGNEPFEEKSGNFEWKLTVEIPFEVIDIQNENLPEMLRVNFYKCADGTAVPHYLSWSHIATETPDFHCSEFFGILYLKK